MAELDLTSTGLNIFINDSLCDSKRINIYFYKMNLDSIKHIFTYDIDNFMERMAIKAPFKIQVPDDVDDPLYVIAYVSNLKESDIHSIFIKPLEDNFNASTTNWFSLSGTRKRRD
jgi:hypothetical protein